MLVRIFWIVLLLIPIYLIIAPANNFDNGPDTCISVLLFNQKCYGCGMTRACQRIIHGEFTQAWEFNKLSFIVFPLLSVVYLHNWVKLFIRDTWAWGLASGKLPDNIVGLIKKFAKLKI